MAKNKKDLLKQLFIVIYILCVYDYIDSTKYNEILRFLSIRGFKTYHVKYIENMIIYQNEIGQIKCYNMLMSFYMRDKYYKKISDIALIFGDMGEIFSNKKKNIFERIINILKLFIYKLVVLNSFKKIDKNSNIIMQNIAIKKDILYRLHLILNHYTLEQLKFMSVKLAMHSVLRAMNFDDLLNFYMDVIKCIQTELYNIIEICTIYLDVEFHYQNLVIKI